eukprot:4750013-Lingulodinium_polyedra.AAC.1
MGRGVGDLFRHEGWVVRQVYETHSGVGFPRGSVPMVVTFGSLWQGVTVATDGGLRGWAGLRSAMVRAVVVFRLKFTEAGFRSGTLGNARAPCS